MDVETHSLWVWSCLLATPKDSNRNRGGEAMNQKTITKSGPVFGGQVKKGNKHFHFDFFDQDNEYGGSRADKQIQQSILSLLY